MAKLVKQINSIVNDAFNQAVAKKGLANIETTDLVSMGKALDDYDLYEDWYGELVGRVVETYLFVRAFGSGRKRSVLRDEHEYGAFVQKVYVDFPEAVENPVWDIPEEEIGGSKTYAQHSPFDVEGTIPVRAKIYGGSGTWSLEFIRPLRQLKAAFTDEASMMAFIDGINVQVENRVNMDISNLENLAVNTAMASCLTGNGKRVNLLGKFNRTHTPLTSLEAREDADFYKFASKKIGDYKKYMENPTAAFSKTGYIMPTSESNLVVEMLADFAKGAGFYLEADTFHNQFVQLPNYEEVSYWQAFTNPEDFDGLSSIDIKHDDLVSDTNETGTVKQSGIVCFMHDVENVACYFGERNTWEMVNPRDRVLIHGEQAEKGYAVDDNANAVVFYMAPAGTLTLTEGEGYTLAANVSDVLGGEEIVITVTTEGTVSKVLVNGEIELEAGSDGKYRYTPETEEDVTVTVTLA